MTVESAESVVDTVISATVSALEASRGLGPEIARGAALMVESLGSGGKVLIGGNGGSSADSCHFATELLCRLKKDRGPLAALSLTADASFLTATSNDYGFEDIFQRQVEGLGREGDVFVGISTSGNSANVLKAFEMAAEKKLKTISLLGKDGGDSAGVADVEILVPSVSTARIQEVHQVIIHCLCSLVERDLLGMSPDI
ncbi:MAG: SIS domain-containing protein [Verrucomicrobiota bacterium]